MFQLRAKGPRDINYKKNSWQCALAEVTICAKGQWQKGECQVCSLDGE